MIPHQVSGLRFRIPRSALGLIVAFLLTGCTLGPDYLRPNFSIPNQHRGAMSPNQAESLADIPWWELFKDPVLQQLTRDAIANNYDLREAAARVDEARAQVGVARSFLYPQVNANMSGTAEQVSRRTDPAQSLGSNRSFQNWFLGLSMAWELDVFGRIRRETEAARNIFLATEQARRGVLITLIGDIGQAYFNLRELDLELEISRRTLGVNDETVEFY